MSWILFLALLLSTQGIPGPNQTGTITGVLKDSAGKPASGVRVGAIAVPDSTTDIANASAMISLAETDDAGRYRLENVPPGRYYVAAGRVDFPTYYPGTLALARGTVVSITSSATVDGIDFALQDSSVRVSFDSLLVASSLAFSLPVQVIVEGGSRLPVFSSKGFFINPLTNPANGIVTDIPVNASSIAVPGPTAEYRVNIENLPAGYDVKSIMVGTTDVKTGTLKVAALTFRASIPAAGAVRFSAVTPMIATTSLTITLNAGRASQPAESGVRVTGRAVGDERRSIYISGKPGIFYSDGTFEFRGVPAGRHTIATVDNPGSAGPLGASVIVGGRDVEGVSLNEIRLIPLDVQSPPQPVDSGPYPAGSVVRLASLRISVLEEGARESAGPGTIYILGPFGTSFDLPADGRLEFPRLLPGKYSFEINVFRHHPITEVITVEDKDIDLELHVTGLD